MKIQENEYEGLEHVDNKTNIDLAKDRGSKLGGEGVTGGSTPTGCKDILIASRTGDVTNPDLGGTEEPPNVKVDPVVQAQDLGEPSKIGQEKINRFTATDIRYRETTRTQGSKEGQGTATKKPGGSKAAGRGKAKTKQAKDTLPRGGTLPGTRRVKETTLSSQRLGMSHWLQKGKGRGRTNLVVREMVCQDEPKAKVVEQRS